MNFVLGFILGSKNRSRDTTLPSKHLLKQPHSCSQKEHRFTSYTTTIRLNKTQRIRTYEYLMQSHESNTLDGCLLIPLDTGVSLDFGQFDTTSICRIAGMPHSIVAEGTRIKRRVGRCSVQLLAKVRAAQYAHRTDFCFR